MRALHQPAVDQSPQNELKIFFFFQVAPRRRSGFEPVRALQESRATEPEHWIGLIAQFAQQDDRVAFILEPLRGDVARVFDQANHRNRRRRKDRAVRALIVQADVPAGDRRVKCATGFSDSANRFPQLPEDFRIVRIAEIEIVGRAERDRAGARQVAGAFRNCGLSTFVRIEINVSRIAIDRERNELFGRALRVRSWPAVAVTVLDVGGGLRQ